MCTFSTALHGQAPGHGKAAVLAAVLASLMAQPAGAVDVINADKAPRDIVVNDNAGTSKALTLAPNEKRIDVCEACVILAGDESVEASGHALVEIKGMKIAIKTK